MVYISGCYAYINSLLAVVEDVVVVGAVVGLSKHGVRTRLSV